MHTIEMNTYSWPAPIATGNDPLGYTRTQFLKNFIQRQALDILQKLSEFPIFDPIGEPASVMDSDTIACSAYISFTISSPPISSPLTTICGKVGQSLIFLSSTQTHAAQLCWEFFGALQSSY